MVERVGLKSRKRVGPAVTKLSQNLSIHVRTGYQARPASRGDTTELVRLKHTDYVTCDGPDETVAKLAWFMCGRAIKPVRPPRDTTELLRLRHSDYVTCDGPMARRHIRLLKYLSRIPG